MNLKRLLILLLASAIGLTSCDKEDSSTMAEWTVASEWGIAQGVYGLQPVLLIQVDGGTTWNTMSHEIEGFDYEPGYEYKIRVEAEKLPTPMEDSSQFKYSLLEQIEKKAAQTPLPEGYLPRFTMEVGPQFIYHDNQAFLSVRFPDTGLNDWQAWPFPIEEFDYELGHLYRLKVATSVVGSDTAGGYAINYTALEVEELPQIE